MSKTNVDYLRADLTTEMQNEWLDGVIKDHEAEIKAQRDEHEAIQSGLEDLVQEERRHAANRSIDCGIGSIRWESNSMDSQRLMEALGEAIREHGVKDVMDQLTQVYGV